MTEPIEACADLQPVSRQRHGGKYWQYPTGYGFARGRRSVPLILADAMPAAACFPIVFSSDPDGPLPCALLRVAAEGQTPFVGPDGRWHAAWLPPFLAAHPFGVLLDESGNPTLAVDEATGLVGDDPRGTPFFTTDGTLSQPLAAVMATLQARAAAGPATLRAGRALRDCGLLLRDDGAGFERVDASRAEALEEAQILVLHRAGALGLLHAAQVSALHFDWLQRAEALVPLRRPAPEHEPAAPQARDFLDALGTAREQQGYIA